MFSACLVLAGSAQGYVIGHMHTIFKPNSCPANWLKLQGAALKHRINAALKSWKSLSSLTLQMPWCEQHWGICNFRVDPCINTNIINTLTILVFLWPKISLRCFSATIVMQFHFHQVLPTLKGSSVNSSYSLGTRLKEKISSINNKQGSHAWLIVTWPQKSSYQIW